jgi:hypothetical protein
LIGPSSDDKYYAKQLDITAKGLLTFTQRGSMWAAAVADAEERRITTEEYMSSITNYSSVYMSLNELWDRDELVDHLRCQLKKKGSFTMLLGGKNTGKSMVLKSLAEENNRNTKGPMVLLVDMRGPNTDMVAAIVDAIKALEEGAGRGLWGTFLNSGGLELFSDALASSFPLATKEIQVLTKMSVSKATEKATEKAIVSYVEAATQSGYVPCIFIDEANIAFDVTSEKDKQYVRSILALFTKLTKVSTKQSR